MEATTSQESLDHRSIAVLGIVTIGVYGAWYYSYGVLLDPILDDTGWRESTLATTFSVGLVLTGVGSVFGGRALDRIGHRRVFVAGGLVSAASLLVASFASSVLVFAVAAAIGLGVAGALGFYHATMATVVRLHPDSPARAIAVLTIWGAFASPIFLPLSARLVDDLGWRPTVRVLASVLFFAFMLGAFGVRSMSTKRETATNEVPLRRVVAATLTGKTTRLFTLAVALGGVGMSTLLVYQVPTMTAAGIPAATAATMAGLRGLFQLGGRLPIGAIVARVGSDGALMAAMSAIGVGGVLLMIADTVVLAALFAMVAGFGIGAFSPLQGMKGQDLFDQSNLGATLGFLGTVSMVFGAAGPFAAGLLVDSTGDRRWAAFLVAVAGFSAALCVLAMSRSSAPKARSHPA